MTPPNLSLSHSDDDLSIAHWPVAPCNQSLLSELAENYVTEPLEAYSEVSGDLIRPANYNATFRGAVVQVAFYLKSHTIYDRQSKNSHFVFGATICEMIIIKDGSQARAEAKSSPLKRRFSGPSFSPSPAKKVRAQVNPLHFHPFFYIC